MVPLLHLPVHVVAQGPQETWTTASGGFATSQAPPGANWRVWSVPEVPVRGVSGSFRLVREGLRVGVAAAV